MDSLDSSVQSHFIDVETLISDVTEGLSTKVDKEDGKSLVDSEFAGGISYVENPEYVDVKKDAEDKVLEGTRIDGTKVVGGDLKVGGNIIIGPTKISKSNVETDSIKANKLLLPDTEIIDFINHFGKYNPKFII